MHNFMITLIILLMCLSVLLSSYPKWMLSFFALALLLAGTTYYRMPEYHYNIKQHKMYQYHHVKKEYTELYVVGFNVPENEFDAFEVRIWNPKEKKSDLIPITKIKNMEDLEQNISVEDVLFEIKPLKVLNDKSQCVIAGEAYYIVDELPKAWLISIPLPETRAVNIQISK